MNKTPKFVTMGKFVWKRTNDGPIAKCDPFYMYNTIVRIL